MIQLCGTQAAAFVAVALLRLALLNIPQACVCTASQYTDLFCCVRATAAVPVEYLTVMSYLSLHYTGHAVRHTV